MAKRPARFFPLGDSALTIEFGTTISESLNQRAIDAARTIEDIRFPGFVETVPAYASVSVFYDPVAVRRAFPGSYSCFEAVRSVTENAIARALDKSLSQKPPIIIAVEFGGDAGPDLDLVAKHNSLSPQKVVSIFLSKIYRVYMLGFLPGFTYMGEVDRRVEMPRKDSPRTRIEAGSVGIAGRQTGIYSLASPGGWQIIGRTDTSIFSPEAEQPCLFAPGDGVRFVEKK